MVKNSISHEALNKLPLQQFNGEIVVVEDAGELSKIIEEINNEKVLGFDTETRPSFKKGKTNLISLIQLSTNTVSYLIRINKTGITPRLKEFLEDKDILKVGVGIRDDLRGLIKVQQFVPGGFVELQKMAVDKGLKDFSLKKLAGILLKFRVSKRQRLSNWEADELSMGQLVYAATDSWVALEIYEELLHLDAEKVIDDNQKEVGLNK